MTVAVEVLDANVVKKYETGIVEMENVAKKTRFKTKLVLTKKGNLKHHPEKTRIKVHIEFTMQ